MRGIRLARRYSEALCNLAVAKRVLDQIEDEFGSVVEIFRDPEVKKVLESPRVSASDKLRLLEAAFEGKVSGLMFSFLEVVVRKGRERYFEEMYHCYIDCANRARKAIDVSVVSARELSSGVLADLEKRLAQVTGRKVRLACRVDPSLIGGMMIQMGDRVIDGSVRARLRMLKASLERQNLN